MMQNVSLFSITCRRHYLIFCCFGVVHIFKFPLRLFTMKPEVSTVVALAVVFSLGIFTNSVSAKDNADDTWFSDGGETVYANFMKVMAAVLISMPEPPKNVTDSVKIVMREVINRQPEKEGYTTYLTNSMFRVFQTPLKGQVDNMLGIMIAMSNPESQMVMAARAVQDYLISPEATKFYEEVETYVKSLFQPVINIPKPSAYVDSEAIKQLMGRPANKVPSHK